MAYAVVCKQHVSVLLSQATPKEASTISNYSGPMHGKLRRLHGSHVTLTWDVLSTCWFKYAVAAARHIEHNSIVKIHLRIVLDDLEERSKQSRTLTRRRTPFNPHACNWFHHSVWNLTAYMFRFSSCLKCHVASSKVIDGTELGCQLEQYWLWTPQKLKIPLRITVPAWTSRKLHVC